MPPTTSTTMATTTNSCSISAIPNLHDASTCFSYEASLPPSTSMDVELSNPFSNDSHHPDLWQQPSVSINSRMPFDDMSLNPTDFWPPPSGDQTGLTQPTFDPQSPYAPFDDFFNGTSPSSLTQFLRECVAAQQVPRHPSSTTGTVTTEAFGAPTADSVGISGPICLHL